MGNDSRIPFEGRVFDSLIKESEDITRKVVAVVHFGQILNKFRARHTAADVLLNNLLKHKPKTNHSFTYLSVKVSVE